MPWEEISKMDRKIEFALKSVKCSNFKQLCKQFGISRKTGYKWKQRFVDGGIEALNDQSRRPHSHANELSEQIVCRIVKLKQAHQHWGPRKIRNLYQRKYPGELPSESSFKRVLEKAGLTEKRSARKVNENGGRLSSTIKAEAPNQVWTVDFKGWWYSSEGHRVEPLTVRDEYSRMILEIRVVANSRTETIQACFENLFEAHGLPDMMRSDNGPPFASANGLLGLSRLSVWWLALGIDLIRGRPGCPQDNGGHERMHADIRKELQAGRIGRDQEAFDLWRHEFNNERPHEALGMAFPSEVYSPSERSFEGTPEVLDYGNKDTRRVTKKAGTIRYNGDLIPVSTTLGGWDVGLVPTDISQQTEVWFTRLLIGHINQETASFSPISK